MHTKILLLAAGLSAAFAVRAASFDPVDVLVYTRWNYVKPGTAGDGGGRAYHHHSTEQGAEEVSRFFTANGLKCLVTENPSFFTSDAMKSLKLILLCNCNHELFETDAQREAFYSFVENGGGLVATHSSSACERGSERFRKLLGGAFERHYRKQQPVPFSHIDRTHAAMACMPEGYVWEGDEIYLNHPDEAAIRPLLILDWKDVLEESRATDKWGCPKSGGHVLEWCKPCGKGRVFYSALGHRPQDWRKPEWQRHLLEASYWAMGKRPDACAAVEPAVLPATVNQTIDGVECVKGGKTVWKFTIANRENKPFIHPLCLPDGRCVTDLRPKDHPWHLGLWFCWKFINGFNYWEPRRPSTSNLFPDGMTVVRDFQIDPKGGACDVKLSMWYGPRDNPGKILLEEERTVSFSKPDAKGGYTIRSTHVFTARVPSVKLDCRRPIGYGGFSMRMSPIMGAFTMSGVGGEPVRDKFEGGGPKGITAVRYVDPETGHGIEVKTLQTIDSERFYTWRDHRFVNPMPIYERPLELTTGESFTLDYEVRVF